jgi:hypothetical protein
MKRDYANAPNKQVQAAFFTGIEVEHSPAKGMGTLFVVGLQAEEQIRQSIEEGDSIAHPIRHIYFGANQSFNPVTADDWRTWEDMIDIWLDHGYWVTLDLDVKQVENLLEGGLTEQRRFIPMISIKLPYIKLLNYNTTIKIDDKGFDATNPGVWCHRLDKLMDIDSFTSWDKYNEDKMLK